MAFKYWSSGMEAESNPDVRSYKKRIHMER